MELVTVMSVFAVVKALATEEGAALLAELEVRLADLKLNAEEHGESMVAFGFGVTTILASRWSIARAGGCA